MKRRHENGISRRALLKGASASMVAFGATPFWMRNAQAVTCGEDNPTFFLHCTFEGAWDQLLALDPRDETVYGGGASGKSGLGIDTAYERIALEGNSDVQTALNQTGGTGIIQAGNLTFGPAAGKLAEGNLYEDLAIVRGINMGTLTHEVGRRYFLTGKFPQGLAANGNDLGTWVAAQYPNDGLCPIPNLVVGMESYNADQEQFASGLRVGGTKDILTALQPLEALLPTPTLTGLDAYLASNQSTCGRILLDGQEQITQYLGSRSAAVNLLESNLGGYFTFNPSPSSNPSAPNYNASLVDLFNTFLPGWDEEGGQGNQLTQSLEGPTGQAMIAAQALTRGVSRAVSVELVGSLDHHDDTYFTDHATNLRLGFDALANLITFLKTQQLGNTGTSYWDHTVLLVSSDFARTPTLNAREGRDHHLCSSCLVGGKGFKTNQVIGASTEDKMEFLDTDLETGTSVPIGSGWTVRPADVQATLLQAAGLDASNLSNQNPKIISSLLL